MANWTFTGHQYTINDGGEEVGEEGGGISIQTLHEAAEKPDHGASV